MNVGEREGNVVPETSQVPYATDGTDFRGAVKYHYAFALKRFVKFFIIFVAMIVPVFVTGINYLALLATVGSIGLATTVMFFCWRLSWTWRCSRVFRRYPLKFRGPVKKLFLKSSGEFVLCLGEEGADGSLALSAINLLPRTGWDWPKGIADGVWFAGDDVFGGVALVPNSGELLFMQPRDWKQLSERREHAGEDRIKRARQAGLSSVQLSGNSASGALEIHP
jgi:hypothetical protein